MSIVVRDSFNSEIVVWARREAMKTLRKAVKAIKKRTKEGVGYAGQLAPYSASYARTHPGPRDLKETGAMLRKLRPRTTKDGMKGYLISTVPYFWYAAARDKFVGLTDEEAEAVAEAARELLSANISAATHGKAS